MGGDQRVVVVAGRHHVRLLLLHLRALVPDWGPYLPHLARGNWRIHGASLLDRERVVILLAIGQSVVAIGVGAAANRSAPLRAGAVLGNAAALGLWWR